MSGIEVQGQGINRHVPQVPEGAERATSPPPELHDINSRMVSESKYSLGGQGGASSSGPQGREGGPSWTDEQSQRAGAFTSEKEIQGHHEITSARPEIADRNAASSSPRLNPSYRAQASDEKSCIIEKINCLVEFRYDKNGQSTVIFDVTTLDDGKVLVNNYFLREKYPQLLIEFYEQDLRSGPDNIHVIKMSQNQISRQKSHMNHMMLKPAAK